MPHLDGTGPGGRGSAEGRRLGNCTDAETDDKLSKLGRGKGLKRRSSGYGPGRGKRFRSGESNA